MKGSSPKIVCVLLPLFILFYGAVDAQQSIDEKHIEVALRELGHRVLLASGDSTSRVMRIEKKDSLYRISFAGEFGFIPDDLQAIAEKVIRENGIASGFILEVEECGGGEVVYSFEVGDVNHRNVLPCQLREYPVACYSLLVSLRGTPVIPAMKENNAGTVSSSNTWLYVLSSVVLLVLTGALLLMGKRRRKLKDPNSIQIGNYHFNVLSGELYYKSVRIELTTKEADLLNILFENVNATVSRDVILNQVWGDEGNYIGRTLDVYISKLRKKLELDPAIKLVNERGVGYKLLLSEQDGKDA